MPDQPMFPQMPCVCAPKEWNCLCGVEECALRHYAYSKAELPAMTPEQREWCLGEADSAAEGAFNKEKSKNIPDRELAMEVLGAWSDYVDSHF